MNIYETVGLTIGVAGLGLAVKGTFHLSRLPRRPAKAPLLPEFIGACFLLSLGSIAAMLGEASPSPWQWVAHISFAGFWLAVAIVNMLRPKQSSDAKSMA